MNFVPSVLLQCWFTAVRQQFLAPCALGKLAHPEGEVVLTRAAGQQKVVQIVPTLSSCTLEEITGAARSDQVLFFQLYVNRDRAVTRALIQRAERGGCKVCERIPFALSGRATVARLLDCLFC
jgi:isopentenyl diphosphate isomerase/L-lactate dehydrogenase-like FMN-dependent dehydrogenase